MGNEAWKTIDGYGGRYAVSSMGRVRSCCNKQVHIISQSTELPTSRKSVLLWYEGKGLRRRVHRLVLEAFVGPCPAGLEACHNDGNASNNNLDNLRWDTHISNCVDRKRHGKERGCFVKGMLPPTTKLTPDEVRAIRRIGRTQRLKEIARTFGIGTSQVSNILLGHCWPNI